MTDKKRVKGGESQHGSQSDHTVHPDATSGVRGGWSHGIQSQETVFGSLSPIYSGQGPSPQKMPPTFRVSCPSLVKPF